MAAASTNLSLKDVINQLKDVTEWFQLGVQLGIDRAKLKQIEKNYQNDIERCKNEVAGVWLDNAKNPSWKELEKAVRNIGSHLSTEASLRRKHQESLSESFSCPSDESQSSDDASSPRRRRSSQRDKELQDLDLEAQVNQLRDKFATVFNHATAALNEKICNGTVTVDIVLSFLKRIPVFSSHDESLFHAVLPALSSKKDPADVCEAIGDHCSWFNHSLLALVIETYCNDDPNAREGYRELCEQFERCCKQRICKCSGVMKNEYGKRERDCAQLIVQVSEVWNDVTLERLEEIKHTVASKLRYHTHTLYLSTATVESNCVQLTFDIPKFVVTTTFPLSDRTEKALSEAGILELHCQDHHFFTKGENLLLLGKAGMGKSKTANKLLTAYAPSGLEPHDQFEEGPGPHPVTGTCKLLTNRFSKPILRILDTRGFAMSSARGRVKECNNDVMHEVFRIQQHKGLVFHRILYFLPTRGELERADANLQEEISILHDFCGARVYTNMIVVATLYWKKSHKGQFSEDEMMACKDVFKIAMNSVCKMKGVTAPPNPPPMIYIAMDNTGEEIVDSIMSQQHENPSGIKLCAFK